MSTRTVDHAPTPPTDVVRATLPTAADRCAAERRERLTPPAPAAPAASTADEPLEVGTLADLVGGYRAWRASAGCRGPVEERAVPA